MKQTARGRIGLAVGLLFAGNVVAGVAWAQNPMSPTMREAAMLRDNPPPGWIRHYLPDDRYKIAGGVWAVVSTATDTRYHRPDCPEMLHQSADNVIGFASAADAREAGYLPDPLCNPDMTPALHFGPGGAAAVSRHAARETLGDGASSLTVPAGWMRLPGSVNQIMGNAMTIDMFKPATGSGMVVVYTMVVPAGVSAASLVDPARAEQQYANVVQMLNTRAATDANAARFRDMIGSMRTRPATLAGYHGVEVTMTSNAFTPGMRGPMKGIMVARGQKLYSITTMGNPAGGSELFSSFRPR